MKELIVIIGFMVAVLAANLPPDAEPDAPLPARAATAPYANPDPQAG